MTLVTRRPTGAIPWPFVLVEGPNKSGRTYLCAELSADKRVGRFYYYDLGEGASDEYGAIPHADYEIIEHDGTWAALMQAVDDVTEVAVKAMAAGEPPTVLFLDNGTAIWELVSAIVRQRARGSRSNRAKIQQDGDKAEITVPPNYWNDGHDMHDALMAKLKSFPGIVLIVADGRTVTAFKDGQPVEGKTDYKVDAERKLEGGVTCWVRLSRDERPVVVGCRSVHYGVRPGKDAPRKLPSNFTMAELIFDILKCDPKTAHVRKLINPDPTVVSPDEILKEALDPGTSIDRLRELCRLTEGLGYSALVMQNERRADEMLLRIVQRIGKARVTAQQQATSATAPAPAAVPETPAQPEPATPVAAAPEPAAETAPAKPAEVKDPATGQGWVDLLYKQLTIDEFNNVRRRIPDSFAGVKVKDPATGRQGKLADWIPLRTAQLVQAAAGKAQEVQEEAPAS